MRLNKRVLFISAGVSVLASMCVLWFVMQRDAQVRTFFAHKMSQIMRAAGCNFVASSVYLNPFLLSVTCHDVRVQPLPGAHEAVDQSWRWACDMLSIRLSWLSLIFLQRLEAVINLGNVVVEAQLDGEAFPLIDHLRQLFFGIKLGMPFTAKILKINNVDMTLAGRDDLRVYVRWSVLSKKIGHQLKSSVYISDGSLTYRGTRWIYGVQGTLYSALMRAGVHAARLNAAVCCAGPTTPVRCLLAAQVDGEAIQANICAPESCLNVALNALPGQPMQLQCKTSCAFLRALGIGIPAWFEDEIIVDAHMKRDVTREVTACVTCKNAPMCARGNYVQGDWRLSADLTAPLQLCGTYALEAQSGIVQAFGSLTDAHFDIQSRLTGSAQPMLVQGQGSFARNELHAQGTCASSSWDVHANLKDAPTARLIVQDEKHEPMVSAHITRVGQEMRVGVDVHGKTCAALLPVDVGRAVRGDGVLHVSGTIDARGSNGDFALIQGSFFLPENGILLQKLTGRFAIAPQERAFVFNDVCAHFHQGTLRCAHARVQAGSSWYVCAPLSFDHCMLGYADVVGVFSGGFDVRLQQGVWQVQGLLTCDQLSVQAAHMLEHAGTVSSAAPAPHVALDVTCVAAKPVRVEVPQFCTQMSGNVHVGGTLQQPRLSGVIALKSGEIRLPFKPLSITHGVLRLVPEHPEAALVDVAAQTTIGSHAIMLQISGPANNPTVCLRSVPALTEEQIAALLITGLTDFSIDKVVPALVADQLKNLIVGGTRNINTGVLGRLLRPLRSVSISPHLMDATGKYDLCGAVALDLGDHVQARVQKNLNLKDDAMLELNYRVIDDLNIKAFKASQGDVGGQVEWRLKW